MESMAMSGAASCVVLISRMGSSNGKKILAVARLSPPVGISLALNERGELIVADASPTSYRELARAQVLGGHCWVAPAVAEGKIYCKNNQGTLVCLDGR